MLSSYVLNSCKCTKSAIIGGLCLNNPQSERVFITSLEVRINSSIQVGILHRMTAILLSVAENRNPSHSALLARHQIDESSQPENSSAHYGSTAIHHRLGGTKSTSRIGRFGLKTIVIESAIIHYQYFTVYRYHYQCLILGLVVSS